MANKVRRKTSVKTVREKKVPYLTKRVLKRAVAKSTRNLSEEALKSKGFIVTVRKGWVVSEDAKGKQTKIKALKKIRTTRRVKLD